MKCYKYMSNKVCDEEIEYFKNNPWGVRDLEYCCRCEYKSIKSIKLKLEVLLKTICFSENYIKKAEAIKELIDILIFAIENVDA